MLLWGLLQNEFAMKLAMKMNFQKRRRPEKKTEGGGKKTKNVFTSQSPKKKQNPKKPKTAKLRRSWNEGDFSAIGRDAENVRVRMFPAGDGAVEEAKRRPSPPLLPRLLLLHLRLFVCLSALRASA